MIEISYGQLLLMIAGIWLVIRAAAAVKSRKIVLLREAKLLMVFICIAVIARIVYFPWHLVDGHIGKLVFDPNRILPFRLNLVPLVHMLDVYSGWKRNLFGNIAMFIPVGIVWPLCFKKLDSIPKVVLAGFAFSLCIELSQLLFYSRGTDIDDLLTNTAGAFIGAVLYFQIKHAGSKGKKRTAQRR